MLLCQWQPSAGQQAVQSYIAHRAGRARRTVFAIDKTGNAWGKLPALTRADDRADALKSAVMVRDPAISFRIRRAED